MTGALKAPPAELTSAGSSASASWRSPGDAELRVDVLQVVVHGADRQEQPLGDGLARLALGGERGDVTLAGGERHDHDERRSGPASGHPRTPPPAPRRGRPAPPRHVGPRVAGTLARPRWPTRRRGAGRRSARTDRSRRRAPPDGRRSPQRHAPRTAATSSPSQSAASSPRRSATEAGSPRRATSWRSHASVIRYPLADARSAAARSTSRAPGRSPVATSAQARPSSCSAGSNRNAGRRSNSSTAAAAAAASPRLA